MHRFLLMQAMEISHDATALIDMDGRITYANSAAGDLLGCRPYEVAGRFLWDMMDDPALVARMLETTLEHGQWHGKVGIRRQNESISMPWRTALIQSREGEVLGILSIAGQPLSQKEMADRLSRFEHQRRLGEMAAGIAHSASQLLTVILGHTQLLDTQGLPSAAEKEVRSIAEAAQKGIELVGRLQKGASETSSGPLEAIDLNQAVQTCIETSRPKWKDQPQRDGYHIEIALDMHARHMVSGRMLDLHEVLINLIFNAVEAMPEGGILRIGTRDDAGGVCIEVADTGIGMNQQTRERLGELFFTTKKNGHGIGLATCYRIVKEMSGTLDIESAPGKGTTFSLRFPAVDLEISALPEPQSDPLQMQAEEAESPLPQVPLRLCTVLVIEDEENIRYFLTQLLADHQVDAVGEGAAGLALYREKRYDMVLIDLALPDMNGVAVAQKLRAVCSDVPLVLMTGWGRISEDTARHFQAILHKPFTIQHLHRLMAKLVAE